MKMADLPSRVVRPLGNWDEYQARAGADGLTPLQSRVLDLLRSGVNSAPDIVRLTGASHEGVLKVLRVLKRHGLANESAPAVFLAGKGRLPSKWEAL